jgi:hypothetical protein
MRLDAAMGSPVRRFTPSAAPQIINMKAQSRRINDSLPQWTGAFAVTVALSAALRHRAVGRAQLGREEQCQ